MSLENVRPVAHPGPNQTVVDGDTVSLDGTTSSDANGDPLSYVWALVSGPPGSAAALETPETPRPRFVADAAGTYVLSLVVHDGWLSSDPANVRITAVTAPDTALALLGQALVEIGALPDASFKNPRLSRPLSNKLNAVIAKVDRGELDDALGQLHNAVIKFVDRCALEGAAHKTDWITDCDAQTRVYPLLVEASALLSRGL